MDGSDVAPDGSGEHLLDVSRLPLRELISSDESALTNCLRHVVAELDDAPQSYAAFTSTP